MAKRKGGGKSGGRGAKRRKSSSRGLGKTGRKAKAKADWYTNDAATGIYGGLSKKFAENLAPRAAGRDGDGGAGRRDKLHGKRGRDRDGPAERARESEDDGDESDEFEDDADDADDDEEEEPDAAYQGLLSSLSTTEGDLETAERGVLDRVRREQEGIEDDEDDEDEDGDEEDDEDDNEDDDQESRGLDKQAATNGVGSADEEDLEDSGDGEEGDDAAQGAEEDAGQGDLFEERFVRTYGLDEDRLENLMDPDYDELAEPRAPAVAKKKKKASASLKTMQDPSQKSKCKLVVGSTKLKCAGVGADAGVLARQAGAFAPERIRKSDEEALASAHQLKARLARTWLAYAERRHRICSKRLGADRVPGRNAFGFTELQASLLEPLKHYTDVNFNARDLGNASELRELYVLHVLNHIMKSRDLVAKHNARLRMRAEKRRRANEAARVARENGKGREKVDQEAEEEGEEGDEDADILDDVIRDQGFTRPQALILVPTRHAALRVMRLMLELFPANANVANKSRIFTEFCEEGGEELADVAKRVRRESASAGEAFDELFYELEEHPFLSDDEARRKGAGGARPADWHDVFTGNGDECFRIGVAINGRKSVRFFSDFYKSDIIIASPLGIRLATGQEIGDAADGDSDAGADGEATAATAAGEEQDDGDLAELGINTREELRREERRKEKESTDFLSSIEVCVIDQAEVIQMQNWQHLVDTMSAVNRKPIELREEMDFARIRPYSLVDGLQRRFRQTLVFSGYPDPFINALTAPRSRTDLNLAGQLTVRRAAYSGVLEDVDVDGIAHKFVRVDDDPAQGEQVRLSYFERHVLPALQRQAAAHTLVVVPSYLDFVSVRRLFRDAAHGLGEAGERAMGKPWRRLRKNRARSKTGKRMSHTEAEGEIEQALFVAVTEYSEHDQITRARGDFFHGRARILLTTERFYFYNRFRLRGIHRLVFFAPPLNARFYAELANLIESAAEPSANLVLFDKRDAMALERVVGTAAAVHMLQDAKKRVFTFTT